MDTTLCSKCMTTMVLLLVLVGFIRMEVKAQERPLEEKYKKISLVIGIPFHNFALPLRDLNSNFTHPGLFMGGEIFYNKKRTLFQQAILGGYLNREIGDGLFINTQFGYRPTVFKNLYVELKAGIGYIRVFHPSDAYRYDNGEWRETNGGKSQLGAPLDIGFGYSFDTELGELSPYINYQVTPSLFYNKTLPVNLYSNVIVGFRMQFFNKE